MIITKATLAHLITLRNTGQFDGMPSDLLKRNFLDTGFAFSALEGGTIYGAGGVLNMWPGVGTLWLAITDDFRKKPRQLLNVCDDMISKIQVNGKFVRLQMFVDAAVQRDIHFTETLGFTFEGKLVRHKPDGGDHLLYARIY